MEADADARAYDALSKHPRLAVLAGLTRSLMKSAAEARTAEVPAARVSELATELGVTARRGGHALRQRPRRALAGTRGRRRASARLRAGRARRRRASRPRAATRRTASAGDSALARRAHAVRRDRPARQGAGRGRDQPLGCRRRPDPARRRGSDKGGVGRGERLVGAVALASSTSTGALRQAATLAGVVRDRKLARVLATRAASETLEPLSGEMTSPPRGPLVTGLLAVTGLLVVVPAVRLLGRVALGYRRPTVVSLSEEGGVRVKTRTELLGRTLRDRDLVVPRAALLRATRDVRYPSLAMYAGLLALAIGSYLGVAAFVDGVRAASPSLLATGLAIVALGLGLDFVLTSLAPGLRGRCRMLLRFARRGQPVRGRRRHQAG